MDILAFPANDFAGQEPGSNSEIQQFCQARDVTFRLFAKISVKGEKAAPLYRFLTDKKLHPKAGGPVAWNFQKYLIGVDGQVLAKFEPKEDPVGETIVAAVEKAIAKVPPERRAAASVGGAAKKAAKAK